MPVRPTRDEQSLLYPKTVVPCDRDSQQLDKGYCPEAAALCSRALFFALYQASGGQLRVDRPAKGSPSGRAGAERLRGQGRCQTALALRSYRSDKEPAYRCAAALSCRACPLRHACGVPLPGLRLPASASLPLASCWPLPQQLLPVSAAGGGRRRCSQGESLFNCTIRLHCGGTSGEVPINKTIYRSILIVCQPGKVPLIGEVRTSPADPKFATLAKFVLQRCCVIILELRQITRRSQSTVVNFLRGA